VRGDALPLTVGGRRIVCDAPSLRGLFATGTLGGVDAARVRLIAAFAVLDWRLARAPRPCPRDGRRPGGRPMPGLPGARMHSVRPAPKGAPAGPAGPIPVARSADPRAGAPVGPSFEAVAAVVIGATAPDRGWGSLARTPAGVRRIGVGDDGLAVRNLERHARRAADGVLAPAVALAGGPHEGGDTTVTPSLAARAGPAARPPPRSAAPPGPNRRRRQAASARCRST
jgi:ribose/xylose/arabinose/galactoside ABC-type transport system permease subunit